MALLIVVTRGAIPPVVMLASGSNVTAEFLAPQTNAHKTPQIEPTASLFVFSLTISSCVCLIPGRIVSLQCPSTMSVGVQLHHTVDCTFIFHHNVITKCTSEGP